MDMVGQAAVGIVEAGSEAGFENNIFKIYMK